MRNVGGAMARRLYAYGPSRSRRWCVRVVRTDGEWHHARRRHCMSSIWMVRAGRGGENVEEFVQHGAVALGDEKRGPLLRSTRKEDLLRLSEEKDPGMTEGSRRDALLATGESR